jgi:hypothetical protein
MSRYAAAVDSGLVPTHKPPSNLDHPLSHSESETTKTEALDRIPPLATEPSFHTCRRCAPAWLSRPLPAPSVAPTCGQWIGGFGLEQSDAEELALLVDALDHVPVELELADNDGGKVNPAGAQLIKRHRLRARLP